MADTKQADAPAQAVNGQAPASAEAPCVDCATGSERLMGIMGIAAAVALLFIGIDLVSGGWLSGALFPGRDVPGAGGE
jgi:hypothetical protein